jgi:hypothetical protein
MDVHKESISIAVMNSVGKVVMECVIETKASTILQSSLAAFDLTTEEPGRPGSFFDGWRGDLHVTFGGHVKTGQRMWPGTWFFYPIFS